MVTSKNVETQILRHYHADKPRIGTIAARAGVHFSVVRRVVAQASLPGTNAFLRTSRITPYMPFIQGTLANFPAMSAGRLYARVRERGYPGGPGSFSVTL